MIIVTRNIKKKNKVCAGCEREPSEFIATLGPNGNEVLFSLCGKCAGELYMQLWDARVKYE